MILIHAGVLIIKEIFDQLRLGLDLFTTSSSEIDICRGWAIFIFDALEVFNFAW